MPGLTAPPRRFLAACLLAVGLICLSQAGNLVRLAEAPVLAIAFWRLTAGALVLAPLAVPQLLRVRGVRPWTALLLGAVFFFAHFVLWFFAVKHTTVANAMLLFAANPLFAAGLGALVLGDRADRRTLLAIAGGVAGTALTTGGDIVLDPGHLSGNLAALAAGFAFAAYLVCGRFYRREGSVWGSFGGTLLVGAALSLAAVRTLAVPLTGFEPSTWLAMAALVVFPTLLGHGSLNYAVKHVRPDVLSGLTLVEPALGGVVAWFLFHEAVPWTSWVGYALITASAVLLVRHQLQTMRDATPETLVAQVDAG